MTIHENGKDREQQMLAAYQLERLIRSLGVVQIQLIETPEHRRDSYDFQIMQTGMWVGVVEVKSRTISSQQVHDWGSILIEVERLKRLRELFTLKQQISGRTEWTKSVVFVWRCVKDDVCFSICVEDIIKNWDSLQDAPEEMMKDNHGKESAAKEGKLIPVDLLTEFK